MLKLNHYYQIEGLLRNNIGDVIQGLAAKQFLNSNALALDRENPKPENENDGLLIGNGWYQHNFENFPPPLNIKPFYISIHIAKSEFLHSSSIRNHFKFHEPIGCRDYKTLWLFRAFGIAAYYSGCLTLTFENSCKDILKTSKVLWVDNIDHKIPKNIEDKLNELFPLGITKISHDPIEINASFKYYVTQNETLVAELFENYKKASLVLTSKIHCAIPCLAMGVPVILIHPNPKDPRLDLIRQIGHIISYDDLLTLNKLPSLEINKRKLNFLRKRMIFLTKKAVESNKNPFQNSDSPKLFFQAFYFKLVSRLFHFFVVLIWSLKIQRTKLTRILGINFLNNSF